MIEHLDRTSSNIQFIQHNANRRLEHMYSCIETAVQDKVDFVLMQESFINSDNTSTMSHHSFYCILSSCSSDIRPRVAIYARKNSQFNYCLRTDLTSDADIMILDISDLNIDTFQLINIYNERDQTEETEQKYTFDRILKDFSLSNETLIADDFNAHHN